MKDKHIKKFYLYDRWFIFEKETDNKIIYYSGKKKKDRSVHIELDKETKDIDILYLIANKLIAKLSVTDIKKESMNFHYQEREPQQIIINDNTYVNLIIELFTSIEKDRIITDKTVKINKKKNLNKMCYLEPDFPINEEINLKDIDIQSNTFNYFLNIIEYIKGYVVSLQSLMEHKEKLKLSNSVNKLDIADELYIYDRNYTFVNRDEKTLYYENRQDGITNLEINIDPNRYLTSINFAMQGIAGCKNVSDLLQISRNELGGVTVKFSNHKKSALRVIGEHFKDYDNAKFNYVAVYDDLANITFNNVEVMADNDEYSLTYHPMLSNAFIDENGNTYRVNGRDFSILDNMSAFAPGIFNDIENILIKKAN